jgi:hypothetical protein
MSIPNPKCSSCSCYFVPTLKSSELPYQTCVKCRNTDKTWREGNQEHIKEYYKQYNQENKEIIAEKKKVYNQLPHIKQKINEKAGENIPCECGMLIRRDWLSRY